MSESESPLRRNPEPLLAGVRGKAGEGSKTGGDKRWKISAGVLVLGFAAALVFARLFPAVEGLGAKVRLPVFHGSLTWANLALFVALAVVSVIALATNRPAWQSWDRALRYSAIGVWLVGTVLGLVAASISWDFTGAADSPITIILKDPRLQLQFLVALVGIVILTLPLLTVRSRVLSAADAVFALGSLAGLAVAMTTGNGLHPDSPVMNSDEIRIKLTFFLMFGAQLVAVSGLTALIHSIISPPVTP
ncbi:MAG: hypothetical protein LBJ07_02860 [Actinomycetes bacterium]|jgi:hypothetical protein|nr:hypothetical protein [Actinomycetes bacterium]